MGNITETSVFEKLAEEQEVMQSDKLYELQRGMQDIQDKIARKGIVHIDHDDLRDILDITVTCLGVEE
mgnify:CR=1 FL=1|tara:strand:- start:52 stop:255 length:204 start_codon:yes stop_codon:yes gene_type:complete